MKRLPILPTVIVALAVATMIGLGFWQISRAHWKEALLARYQSAQGLPATAFPTIPPSDDALLFRRASGFCLSVTGWRPTVGRNLAGEPGWSHIASCRTGGAEGPGMQVDMGWSSRADPPAWKGGRVTGVIAPDRDHRIRLIAASPAPGLQASAPPSPADIPNNHRSYALQWFAFAAAAAIIYALALRRRSSGIRPPDASA